MQFGTPILLPLCIVVLVARVAEMQHIIQLIRYFLAECVIDGQLVIVHHALKVVCPSRECIARYFALVDEFLHPA